jgi:thiamine biosynthesis lipoprotein
MRIYLILFAASLLLGGCSPQEQAHHLRGEAQGTTFSIKYHGEGADDYSSDIATILTDFDKSLSLWREDSFLSQVNADIDSIIRIPPEDLYFIPVLQASQTIHRESRGAFDPSVYPLVRAWGFGAIPPDSDSIPDVISLQKEHHIGGLNVLIKEIGPNMTLLRPAQMELDFNGIAQGYSVDVIGDFLESNGIGDYMVEIGGELLAKGSRPDGDGWSIGIDRPQDGPRELIDTLTLYDAAVATSGSYRKYKERDGKRYSHCIDPRTGYPVDHTLLSVTVIAPTCMEADAYATAFMVMGVEESLERLKRGLGKKLEVMMIYDDQGENRIVGTGRFGEAN